MKTIKLKKIIMLICIFKVMSLYLITQASQIHKISVAKPWDIYIGGENQVQIPEHGESIAFYEVVGGENKNYSFKTINREGILLDATGKLTLTTSVQPQKIEIVVKDEKGIEMTKEVELVIAHRTLVEDFTFYAPEELEAIHYPFSFVTDDGVKGVKIMIILGLSSLLGSYFVFRLQAKKNREYKEKI